MLIFSIPRLMVAASPIVTGMVVDRAAHDEWADFAIALPDSSVIVHARTQRYLLDKVPVKVRFHYSGDPSRQVYLFEHEENPLWIGLFCWALAIAFGVTLYLRSGATSTAQMNRVGGATPRQAK
jgi:hypothetical protein